MRESVTGPPPKIHGARDILARWDSRASADALTLHVLKAYQEADRLVPLEQDTSAEDAAQALKAIDGYNPAEANLKAIEARLVDTGGQV